MAVSFATKLCRDAGRDHWTEVVARARSGHADTSEGRVCYYDETNDCGDRLLGPLMSLHGA